MASLFQRRRNKATQTERVRERTGVFLPEEAFRPDLVATHLRLLVSVVDEKGKVVAQSRDARDLQTRFGARAREVVRETKAPQAWDRKGLVTWDFGELPAHVERRAAGLVVRAFPALVDRGAAVDLVLLESAPEAEKASRAGVRRLLMLASRAPLSTITPRLPSAFARPNGAMASRTDHEAFRQALLARIADAAFDLEGDAPLPRTKAAFDALVKLGAPRLEPVHAAFARVIAAASAELEKTLTALRAASKHPSGRAAVQEMFAQLEELFPADLVAWVPLARLEHYPRYLRAVQARLSRAVTDPPKDAGKLAPLTPLWTQFLVKRKTARDQAAARELRWAFEELRVAIFAPELKTPAPVSVAKVSSALAALR